MTTQNQTAVNKLNSALDRTKLADREAGTETMMTAFQTRLELQAKTASEKAGEEIAANYNNFKSLKTSRDQFFGLGTSPVFALRAVTMSKATAFLKADKLSDLVINHHNQKAITKIVALFTNARFGFAKHEKVFMYYLAGLGALFADNAVIDDQTQKQLLCGEHYSKRSQALLKACDAKTYAQISKGGMTAQQPQSRDIAQALGVIEYVSASRIASDVKLADRTLIDVATELLLASENR